MTPLSKFLLERLITEAYQHGRCHAKGEALNVELRQARQAVEEISKVLYQKEREDLE